MELREFLTAGDLVQLDPSRHLQGKGFFAGCFMVVTELTDFGAVGYVLVPQKPRGTPPKQAVHRAVWDEMVYAGKAKWITQEPSPRPPSAS